MFYTLFMYIIPSVFIIIYIYIFVYLKYNIFIYAFNYIYLSCRDYFLQVKVQQ